MRYKTISLLKGYGLSWVLKNREKEVFEQGSFENVLLKAEYIADITNSDPIEKEKSLFQMLFSNRGKIIVTDATLFEEKMGISAEQAELFKSFKYNVGLTHLSYVDRLLEIGYVAPSDEIKHLEFAFTEEFYDKSLKLEVERITGEEQFLTESFIEGYHLKKIFSPDKIKEDIIEKIKQELIGTVSVLNESLQAEELIKKIIVSVKSDLTTRK